MRRLTSIICFILIIITWGVTASTQAQPYPNQTIQLVVPSVPGSLIDITGRLLADEFKKFLGVPVIVLNKPGAGLTLGTDAVVRSKKNGYTLAYTGAPAIVHARVANPETVPYDPETDLEPLGLHLFLSLTITVQESSPWKTFNDLIDYARNNPGKLRISSIGVGTVNHFNIEIL